MSGDLLRGELVRLTAINPETDSHLFVRWALDTEYWRLLANDPARPWSVQATRKLFEEDLEKSENFFFLIRTLTDDRPIGMAELDGAQWTQGEAWLGIGLGERSFWGQGYGSDAARLIMRFGFEELNLHRISLTVFEYNPRAIRAYEKLGFVHEGRGRGLLLRDGRRWDILFMGLLRSEWQAKQP